MGWNERSSVTLHCIPSSGLVLRLWVLFPCVSGRGCVVVPPTLPFPPRLQRRSSQVSWQGQTVQRWECRYKSEYTALFLKPGQGHWCSWVEAWTVSAHSGHLALLQVISACSHEQCNSTPQTVWFAINKKSTKYTILKICRHSLPQACKLKDIHFTQLRYLGYCMFSRSSQANTFDAAVTFESISYLLLSWRCISREIPVHTFTMSAR